MPADGADGRTVFGRRRFLITTSEADAIGEIGVVVLWRCTSAFLASGGRGGLEGIGTEGSGGGFRMRKGGGGPVQGEVILGHDSGAGVVGGSTPRKGTAGGEHLVERHAGASYWSVRRCAWFRAAQARPLAGGRQVGRRGCGVLHRLEVDGVAGNLESFGRQSPKNRRTLASGTSWVMRMFLGFDSACQRWYWIRKKCWKG